MGEWLIQQFTQDDELTSQSYSREWIIVTGVAMNLRLMDYIQTNELTIWRCSRADNQRVIYIYPSASKQVISQANYIQKEPRWAIH